MKTKAENDIINANQKGLTLMKCIKAFTVFAAICLISFVFSAVAFADDTDPKPADFFTYTVTDGEVAITGFSVSEYEGAVTIPEEIDGCPVTVIESSFFAAARGNIYITTLTLPSTLVSVGDCLPSVCVVERFAISELNEYFSTDYSGSLFNKNKTVFTVKKQNQKL